jgi:hypothetical protein
MIIYDCIPLSNYIWDEFTIETFIYREFSPLLWLITGWQSFQNDNLVDTFSGVFFAANQSLTSGTTGLNLQHTLWFFNMAMENRQFQCVFLT